MLRPDLGCMSYFTMASRANIAFVLSTLLSLCLISRITADDDVVHRKVIIHVPYKIHTIHHHIIKKIPVYHYYDHHDHHHHHLVAPGHDFPSFSHHPASWD